MWIYNKKTRKFSFYFFILPKGGKILQGTCPCIRDKLHVWIGRGMTKFLLYFNLYILEKIRKKTYVYCLVFQPMHKAKANTSWLKIWDQKFSFTFHINSFQTPTNFRELRIGWVGDLLISLNCFDILFLLLHWSKAW